MEAFAVHIVLDEPANDRALKRTGIATPSYFVLRPDGYIALSGGRLRLEDIDRYFATREIRLQSSAQGQSASLARTPDECGVEPATELDPGR